MKIMTAELGSTTSPDFVATLSKAAAAFRDRRSARPSAKAVVNALVQAEKATKQQRLTYPVESLLGNWRLCFTAPRKAHLKGDVALGKGFYLPQMVVLQKLFESRKSLRKGVSYAATPKISAMNLTRLVTAPFATP